MMRFSSSSERGPAACMAATALSGLRFTGKAGSRSIMSPTRAVAARTRAGIAAVSGMLRQYFFGISARMAVVFSRAGLKVLS